MGPKFSRGTQTRQAGNGDDKEGKAETRTGTGKKGKERVREVKAPKAPDEFYQGEVDIKFVTNSKIRSDPEGKSNKVSM